MEIVNKINCFLKGANSIDYLFKATNFKNQIIKTLSVLELEAWHMQPFVFKLPLTKPVLVWTPPSAKFNTVIGHGPF